MTQDEHAPPPSVLVLRPRWVIDGISEAPLSRREIWIEGEDITHVGTVGDRPTPPDARIRTMVDETVLPGLIDCHVHYLFDSDIERGNSVEAAAVAPAEEAVLLGARNARRALAAGITTARSAGAPLDLDIALAAAIERGDVPGPHIIAAGRAVTITGGHGAPFGITADDRAEMVRAVRILVAAGARVVKAIASEAAMLTGHRAGISEMSEQELRAIVSEADRLGVRVMAHAQNSESVHAAANAGVASIEHAFLADESALTAVARSGAALTPTLVVTETYGSLPGLTEDQRARQEVITEAHRRSCEMAIELGIPLVAGTDCGLRGIGPDVLWREIELLGRFGLPPMEAIWAATSRAARVVGMDDRIGSIEPGKRADLVAVQGLPTEDLGVLARPTLVVREGRDVASRDA